MKKTKKDKMIGIACVVCIVVGLVLVITSFMMGDYTMTEIMTGKSRYIVRNGNWVYSIIGGLLAFAGYIILKNRD